MRYASRMGSPPWSLGPAACDPIPASAEVLVVGGGLAGVAVAAGLAERGVDVVLLEARSHLGGGSAGRHLGHVSTGPIEPAHRVVDALGLERATELYRFCLVNQAILREMDLLEHHGGWWAAVDPRERAELALGADALDRAGVPVVLRDDPPLGGRGLGPALHLPGEGALRLDAVARLAARAMAGGARLRTNARAAAMTLDARGAVVHAEGRAVVAEVVVLTAELGLPALDPWFRDKLTPVREQALTTEAIPRLPVWGGRAGHGYTFWRQLAGGALGVGGCRWATPHLEVGETDEVATVPAIQRRIEDFVARTGWAADAPVTRRWSWIVAHTCDGLPIVGPLPGAPRQIACCGFGGNEPGYALAAASAVVDGLLGTGAPNVPSSLTPSRFL